MSIKTADSLINKTQERILKALVKAGKPLGKERLCKLADVHPNWLAEHAGTDGKMVSKLVRGNGTKKLIASGLIKIIRVPIDGVDEKLYEVTKSGRKAVQDAPA